ncbi:MAG: rod shape-determining protein [Gemmatimonadota bacterium]|jgi:rod shape-determining protein MreB|nr:rod shape-determining protein [Gemmatimonadota bacterium]
MPDTDIAMDLGTTNTLVHVRGLGIVLDEPSVVAVERSTQRVLAVGTEAKRALVRRPEEVVAVRPASAESIADRSVIDVILSAFLERIRPRRRLRWSPDMLITVPAVMSERERQMIISGAVAAGAGSVHMLSGLIATAIGAGLLVHSPRACMVVNIGGGLTEIGVIAPAGLIARHSIRIAGESFNTLIASSIFHIHNLLIGDSTAELVKMRIGSARVERHPSRIEVNGRDASSGQPRSVGIDSTTVSEALHEPLRAIVNAIRSTLNLTPPKIAAEIAEEGIILSGGGACLRGMDRLISEETGLPVRTDPRPMMTVAKGAGIVLDDMRRYGEALSA